MVPPMIQTTHATQQIALIIGLSLGLSAGCEVATGVGDGAGDQGSDLGEVGAESQALTVRYDTSGESFFDTPWPSDGRLDDRGHVDLTTFPDRDDPFVGLFLDVITEEVRGFSPMPVVYIRAVEVQAADPAAMAGRWSEVLGIPNQGTKLPLDEGEVRFVEALDGRGEGVSGLELAASRNARFELGGVRVSLVP